MVIQLCIFCQKFSFSFSNHLADIEDAKKSWELNEPMRVDGDQWLASEVQWKERIEQQLSPSNQ
jgi:hypothetical protein